MAVLLKVDKPNEVRISGKKKRLIRMVKGAAGLKSKPPTPIFPNNSLSIVERYFHRMPSSSAQVILTYGGRVTIPNGSKYLSVERVVDIFKLTSAEIFRTASILDYETQTFAPMGTTAQELRIPYKFTVLDDDELTYVRVAREELNQHFNTSDPNLPLWNIHIVGPKEMLEGITATEDADFKFPPFYVFFSFHHCICDGLSGWSFIRLFLTKMGPESFQIIKPDLNLVAVTTTPPPLLDNLIDANFIELLPALLDFLIQRITIHRFKPSRLKYLASEKLVVLPSLLLEGGPITASNVKFFTFDEKFSEMLRINCRANKTTIAAAVISAALYAVRKVFTPRAEKQQKKLPSYQAWVVTSSTRHLLPNSKLLEGADKAKDPSLMEFGGYGGSMVHDRFKFNNKSELWERGRAVKAHLSRSFLRSMRRMKLMNYLFRKQSLWKKLQKKIDLDEITRAYSVEVANLGSWNDPYAPLELPRSDLATADWFAGTLNNSFHGARALFTVAVISINNVMSFSASYDMSIISEAEGALFVQEITKALTAMKESSELIHVAAI